MNYEVLSALWGIIFAAVNICIAIITFRIALRQEDITVFMRLVFGSMAGRMVVTLFAVWYALRIWHIATLPFVVTLLFCYIAVMSGEIVILHRKQLAISRAMYAAKRENTQQQDAVLQQD
ncbi:MAG: hypothetical protein ACOVSW_19665 [Candidatus Kapaibacteriota bacterium]